MNTDTRVVSVGQLPLVQQGLLLHKMAQTLYPHEVFIHRLSIRYRKPNLLSITPTSPWNWLFIAFIFSHKLWHVWRQIIALSLVVNFTSILPAKADLSTKEIDKHLTQAILCLRFKQPGDHCWSSFTNIRNLSTSLNRSGKWFRIPQLS